MGYPQFSMRFSDKSPKRSKSEIDGEYMDYYNRGISYVPTVKGPIYLSEWKKQQYKENKIPGDGE